ncbi:MAG TPA: squalene/phytoene synthase family protein [Thermoanaerobaculia bacterium]|nr:squalene/phytoene synthase family protein [Thermoanaerobaculia bacterium]
MSAQPPPAGRATGDRIDDLLAKTSRTFALSIPLLPEPTRRQVAVAYLLFRIADTFEDATLWGPRRQGRALLELAMLLAEGSEGAAAEAKAAAWRSSPPLGHAGYLELLEETPRVVASFHRLAAQSRHILRRHLRRTLAGMAWVARRRRGGSDLRLADLGELRGYCYVVAGIVGEMLTDVYLHDHRSLAPVAEALRQRAAIFGEGLQLVNILKDAAVDAGEGRVFLPPGTPRSEVLALARRDLDAAADYVLALQQVAAPRGLVAFNALPVLLARASLQRLEAEGPGAKLARPEVFEILAALEGALDAGEPVIS